MNQFDELDNRLKAFQENVNVDFDINSVSNEVAN